RISTAQKSGGDRRNAKNAGAIHERKSLNIRPTHSQNRAHRDALLYAADLKTESTALRIWCSGM
ncbi:MAG TPA: hypothetical protein VGJ12_14430, partial [Gemmatimonadaceae bacterium]